MRANFGAFGDDYDGRRMQTLVAELERLFSRVRIDDQIIIGGGTPIKKYLSATATWNPGSLTALGWGVSVSNVSTTVTVTGAALGDLALASFSLDLQGLELFPYVSAANTVTCVLSNKTATTVNLAEGTLRASVLQH